MPAKGKKRATLGQKGARSKELFDLECPSGETCRVRRPGIPGLIAMGLLDSLDQLTSLVGAEHFDRVDGKIANPQKARDAAEQFAKNQDAVKAGFALLDRLVVGCVIEPRLSHVPKDANGAEIPLDEREGLDPDWDEETVYVDQVDLEDRAFIMDFAIGGSNDLAAFRKEREGLVGDVADVQGIPVPAKRTPRSRKPTNSVLSR